MADMRTFGNHRRYKLDSLKEILNPSLINKEDDRINICYSRVRSHGQKDDLKRQSATLEDYCKTNEIKYKLIEDLGSGKSHRLSEKSLISYEL